jgi:hypothetical protein
MKSLFTTKINSKNIIKGKRNREKANEMDMEQLRKKKILCKINVPGELSIRNIVAGKRTRTRKILYE